MRALGYSATLLSNDLSELMKTGAENQLY